MGGAVSSGESNDELIDNLMEAEYIKTPLVEKVFRSVDRAFYYTKSNRQNPYQDLAWRNGNLHLSAPCIYSEVLENLELEPGLSFLNIGSGTGYLSTMAGLMLGRGGMNHGIELHADVVEYARFKLEKFKKSSAAVDIFELCEPQFVVGNCMDALPVLYRYDRIYCGAACPPDFLQVIIDSLKIGGVTIVPVNDSLVRIRRLSESRMESKTLLSVSFASLVTKQVEPGHQIPLLQFSPLKLSEMCRIVVREAIRKNCLSVTKSAQESKVKGPKKKSKKTRLGACIIASRSNNDLEGHERVLSHISASYPGRGTPSASDDDNDRSSVEDLPNVPDEVSNEEDSDSVVSRNRSLSTRDRSDTPRAGNSPFGTPVPHPYSSSDSEDDDEDNISKTNCRENNGNRSSQRTPPMRTFSPSNSDSDNGSDVCDPKKQGDNKSGSPASTSSETPSSHGVSSSASSVNDSTNAPGSSSDAPAGPSHKRNIHIRQSPDETKSDEGNGERIGEAEVHGDDDLSNSASRVKRVCLNSHVSHHEESNSSNSTVEEEAVPRHNILYLHHQRLLNGMVRPPSSTTDLSEEYTEETLPEINHPVTVQMRSVIQSLPLPTPIKMYLNYDRSL